MKERAPSPSLILLLILFATLCLAHIPIHDPPPPPPPPPPSGPLPAVPPPSDMVPPNRASGAPASDAGAFTPSNRGNPLGTVSTPARPSPVHRHSGSQSGASMTRKRHVPTAQDITWERWWARNRYQYMDFPGLEDSMTDLLPVTPAGRGNTHSGASISRLKKQSIQLFRPMLNHNSARLRRAALIGLAMLDDTESLPMIEERLQDMNQTVRDSAVLALGILKHPGAKHTLLHLAQGTDLACKMINQSRVPDYFRGFAEVSLALDGVEGVETTLHDLACDTRVEPQVRAMAIEGIGLIGGDDSVKYLIDFIEESDTPNELLSIAMTALGKTGEPVALPFLKKCLLARELAVRQSAALSLGQLAASGDEAIVEALFRVFTQTNDQALKGFALISMGKVGGERALSRLDNLAVKGRKSDQPWACIGLGFALRHTRNQAAINHLILQATRSASRSTRGAAAIGLGLAGEREAIPMLSENVKKGDDPWYRGYCALALGLIGDRSALQVLKAALEEDPLPQVKTQAAMALAMMDDTQSCDSLIDLLLETDNDTTKGFLSLSLSYMADLKTVERINESIQHETLDDLTLAHLVHLQSKLLSGRAEPYLDRLATGSNFACEYPMVAYLLGFGI